MPVPGQRADPLKLRPAIESAKEAGVEAATIAVAEAKLLESTDEGRTAWEEKTQDKARQKAESRGEREAERTSKSEEKTGKFRPLHGRGDRGENGLCPPAHLLGLKFSFGLIPSCLPEAAAAVRKARAPAVADAVPLGRRNDVGTRPAVNPWKTTKTEPLSSGEE